MLQLGIQGLRAVPRGASNEALSIECSSVLVPSPPNDLGSGSAMIRVLVVDDNQEFRGAVRDLLEGDLQIRVVGEACDGLQAISLTAHLQPDLILMDIAMPLMNGLEATSAIRERWPKVIVILVTAIPSNSYQQISDRCGANAFLPKEEMGSRLISTMHRLACATLPG